eukprot:3875715-Amphidinium_carterae.1
MASGCIGATGVMCTHSLEIGACVVWKPNLPIISCATGLYTAAVFDKSMDSSPLLSVKKPWIALTCRILMSKSSWLIGCVNLRVA